MYNARITFRQFETYINLLSSQGLLARKSQEYLATQKGHRFVQAFGQLQSTLDGVPTGMLTGSFLIKRGQSKIMVEDIDYDTKNSSQ